MKVGLAQFDIAWENPEQNKVRLRSLCAGADVDWLVLPEMALTGFSMNRAASELKPGDLEFCADLAREHRCAVTVGGVVEGRNCAVTFSADGRQVSQYAKTHLFSYSGEHKHYEPGISTTSLSIAGMRVMPAICYDLRFADMFWAQGPVTDVFVVIANWPASRREHWITLLRARAVENQAFVIGVNRIGRDPNVAYAGDSQVVDPFGEILVDAGAREGIFVAELSTERLAEVRAKFPFLADRKITTHRTE